MKKPKHLTSMSTLNQVSILFLVGMAVVAVVNAFCTNWFNTITTMRSELTYWANQFMDASSYLTNEVRAYAATGQEDHYINYRNEADSLKNRDKSYAKMKEIGITKNEESLLKQMSSRSVALESLEADAIDMASNGDLSGALDIVYGTYYNREVKEIVSLQDHFLDVLNQRTSSDMERARLISTIVNVATWVLVAITVFLQLIQKRRLYKLAYQDPLTGGDNYSAFREKMKGGAASGSGYVVAADLRSFGIINSICGMAKGDEVIRSMSRVFEDELGHGELSAHVNDDRFIMFLHSPSETDLIGRISSLRHNIIDLSPMLEIPSITPQFGIRPVDSPYTPESSFSDANLAKQKVGEKQNFFYCVFDEETQRKEMAVQELENSFEPALEDRQFEMWYQPKYDPDSGTPVAAEALVRWRKPDDSLVPPGQFIPLFERNGMIAQLDEYTFDAVCRQQRAWQDQGKAILPVSVNVSRASLFFDDIAARYMVILHKYDLPAEYIELEITESAVAEGQNMDERLDQFLACGFHLLVDDFGSGYSSLSTLTKKRFHNVKLDKSLIDCIGMDEGNLLLNNIIPLTHKFHMTVTAEGVEDARQVEFLKNLACDNIQGYYYSRPLPVDDFSALLANRQMALA